MGPATVTDKHFHLQPSFIPTRMGVSMSATRMGVSMLVALLTWALTFSIALAQESTEDEPPLPERRVVINVDSAERALYRIAIPNLLEGGQLGGQAADVIRNDLRLISLFEIVDSRSFIANLQAEGLGVVKNAWTSIGAQGVVKGKLQSNGNNVSLDMRLYEVARGEQPILSKRYSGSVNQLRGYMHDFANLILKALTGQEGAFGTRMVFARKLGPGRKDIYVTDFDGSNQTRVSSGKGNSMLPAFGPGGVWYSELRESGMCITSSTTKRPVIQGNGLNMGVTFCGGRMYFTSTRDGNSELYSANADGSGVRRLTNHPGIDVSPTCGPNGQIIFVSNRHGGPQIFMMSGSGGEPKRLTYKGNHNQTPSFCQKDGKELLAFSGRDGSGFDIFTLDLKTGEYTRLTQGQGINQDPTFSPDCRMVAFASSRGGIFITGLDGLNQTKVVSGNTSTVRWGN